MKGEKMTLSENPFLDKIYIKTTNPLKIISNEAVIEAEKNDLTLDGINVMYLASTEI